MPSILPLTFLDKDDYEIVGSKGVHIGELIRSGIPTPKGFVITTEVQKKAFLKKGLERRIQEKISELPKNRPEEIAKISASIAHLIDQVEIPKSLEGEILQASKYLLHGRKSKLAVRSSGLLEDHSGRSFAGEFSSFLNVSFDEIVSKIKNCWASQFSPKAIAYAQNFGIDITKSHLAIVVQDLVNAEVSGSGFTVNPVNGKNDEIIIEAIWGLGPLISYGRVIPDRYIVQKDTPRILSKVISEQKTQIIESRSDLKEIPVAKAYQKKQKISDEEIIEIASLAKKVESLFYYPQNFEWAKDAKQLFILQSRPMPLQTKSTKEEFSPKLPLALSGVGASKGIGWGKVKIVKNPSDFKKFSKGDVMVTVSTSPEFVWGIERASAVVTDRGGLTSHAAILARELGKPCIVATGKATELLRDGQIVTADGSRGKVFLGRPDFNSKTIPQKKRDENEAPATLRSGYLLPALRRERNPSEAEIASHSSASLRSRFSAKGDKVSGDRSKLKTATKIFAIPQKDQEFWEIPPPQVSGLCYLDIFGKNSRNLNITLDYLDFVKKIFVLNEEDLQLFLGRIKSESPKKYTLAVREIQSKRNLKAAIKDVDDGLFTVIDLPIHLFQYKHFMVENKLKGFIIDIRSLLKNSLSQKNQDETIFSQYFADESFLRIIKELIVEVKKNKKEVMLLFEENFDWDFLRLSVESGCSTVIVPFESIDSVSNILSLAEEEHVRRSVSQGKRVEEQWPRLAKF